MLCTIIIVHIKFMWEILNCFDITCNITLNIICSRTVLSPPVTARNTNGIVQGWPWSWLMKAIPLDIKMIVLHAPANKNSIIWLIRFRHYENRTSSLSFDFNFFLLKKYWLYRASLNWATISISNNKNPIKGSS